MRHVCLSCQKRTISISSLPLNTPRNYAYYGLWGDGCPGETAAGRKAPILFLLCEHTAILVVLVFLRSLTLNRIFSIRTACYVHSCTIVLNISAILEDRSTKMLIKLFPHSQTPPTPTRSSTPTTPPQNPPPYQHPNNNPNAAAESNPHANKYHPPNDNPY